MTHRAAIREEDLNAEQQQRHLSVEEEEPELPHVKEEAEEADISRFPVIHVIVKSEDDEDEPHSSQLHHSQSEKRRSQADSHLAPSSVSDDTLSRSPDTDDEHSKGSETDRGHPSIFYRLSEVGSRGQ
ncbi:uncharacterized protein LOC133399030 isoform X3 [Phycodurus eques]|uniref:uncharacterized protein LOC133399030 isoform X3 n=1 Tax=Phycodurus eques TaxID=693459 RepID=UPI002ACEB950|nr:uncharacterized protein LOC133399030 isoform X3 [Phycodurus eques]